MIHSRACLLWVKTGHSGNEQMLPVCSRKRTSYRAVMRTRPKLLASILLAVSLSACLEMPPTQAAPEQALRDCQASNPYSEGQEYVDYERDCYSKYNEAKGLPR
jgi:hypothetical protein